MVSEPFPAECPETPQRHLTSKGKITNAIPDLDPVHSSFVGGLIVNAFRFSEIRIFAFKLLVLMLLAITACIITPRQAISQSFPNGPVTLLLYAPPGGILDVVARSFAQKISPSLGQPIVIDYKPGGSGAIAAETLLRSAPDGQTILFDAVFNHTVLPRIQKLRYDPVGDFQPITTIFSTLIVLAVPKQLPVRTPAELIAYAKTKPGGLSFGSQGNGSPGHILGTLYQAKANVPMTHIPYKGANLLQTDLIAGRLDFGFISYSTAQTQINDLRILAIASPNRWSATPDIPTMAELGFPGVDFDTWFAIFAPKGTPPAAVERLRIEFNKAAQDKELITQLSGRGLFVKTGSPSDVSEMINSETQKVNSVLNRLNLTQN